MKYHQMIRVFKHRHENRYLIKLMDFTSCGNTVRYGYKGSPVEVLASFQTNTPGSDYQRIVDQFKHCKCTRASEWYKFNLIQYFNLEYELAKVEGVILKPSKAALLILAFVSFILSLTISSSLSVWTLNNNTNSKDLSENYSFKQLE